MVYRYSWIAGSAAITFALWRLGGLLEPTQSGAAWQLVVVAALVFGLIVTRTAAAMKTGWIALLNLGLFLIAAARYGAPGTGFWILPGPDTLTTLSAEIERAGGLIRYGIEPVEPIVGLVVLLAGLFWALGALLSFGLFKGRPFVALIPPLVVGLQLLTIEREPSSNAEIALFVLLVAATALAVGLDEQKRGAGRMARPAHHPSLRPGAPLSASAFAVVGLTIVAAIGVSSAAASQVPADGVMAWRAPGSLTAGQWGSISYNPYVDIYKGLVSQTGRELFTAELSGDVSPGDVYYRLITLDTYDNGKWYASESELARAEDGRFEDDGYAYAGPTEPVTASITIAALRQDWLPAPYAVRGVAGEDAGSFRFRTSDVSVNFAGNRTYNGMEYEVAADVPVMDSAAIVTDASGRLSPLFLVAAEDGQTVPTPNVAAVQRRLPDAERYLRLPDGLDTRIRAKALELTGRLGTDFEKGLALEYWFRETGGFVYSLDIDIEQGHGPDALAAWLFDDTADGYRRGYCEQFATSMGVMARSIGIPTRVVLGFLPGDINGDEVVVRDLSAHSWVELWIPSQGWMRFDPTPRGDGLNPERATYRRLGTELGFDIAAYLEQVPDLRADDDAPLGSLDPATRPEPGLAGDPLPEEGTGNAGGIPIPSVLVLGALIALALGVVPALKWARRRSRMRRLARGDVGAAWEEIVVQLADLDHPADPAATPNEVAHQVDAALHPLASVYAKSIYGPNEGVSAGDVDVATRSMILTSERLAGGLTPSQRVRAAYRLSPGLRWRDLSRRLPWLRR